MKQSRTKRREHSLQLCVLHPLLGERAGVRASVSPNLILGVGGVGGVGGAEPASVKYAGYFGDTTRGTRRQDAGVPSSPKVARCSTATPTAEAFFSVLPTGKFSSFDFLPPREIHHATPPRGVYCLGSLATTCARAFWRAWAPAGLVVTPSIWSISATRWLI